MLARNLGLDVVAEGVETKEQLAYLQALNCEYAQGFLFSRPVDAVAIERQLNALESETVSGWDRNDWSSSEATVLSAE
jgi:EAL domain-containing protein (putative c-di-GMP-specific phosphodiesterase class I)